MRTVTMAFAFMLLCFLGAATVQAQAGSIVAWGMSSSGLGTVPTPNAGFVAIAAGGVHSLGLRADGSIASWGSDAQGQCTVPAPNSGFVAVAAGYQHSLGIKSDGTVMAWGANGYGQCTVPTPNTGFVAVAAGVYHSLGLKSDGTIVAWGRNNAGQCTVPPAGGSLTYTGVAAGSNHSLGLRSDGTISAWGSDGYGQRTVPSPNTGFLAIAAGVDHSLGLKAGGTIVAWGSNGFGQCTVPSPNTGFVAVAGGSHHSLGLKSDGTIVAWGGNSSGECNVPAPNTDFAAIAAGGNHSLGLRNLPQAGACCDPSNGACALLLQAACTSPSIWHSEWLSCSPNPCPQPGACCNPGTGACTLVLQTVCTSPLTWNGATGCTPNPCPQPTGSCCIPNGTCFVTTAGDCAYVWTAAGICVPNSCSPSVPGACCLADGSCQTLARSDCTAAGACFRGNESCLPNPCTISSYQEWAGSIVWDQGMWDQFAPPSGCSWAISAGCFVHALNPEGLPLDGRHAAGCWLADGQPITHIKVWGDYGYSGGYDYHQTNPCSLHGFCVTFYEKIEDPFCPDGTRSGEEAIGPIVYEAYADQFLEREISTEHRGNYKYRITLPEAFAPIAGRHYWVSVSADFDYVPVSGPTTRATQWFWRTFDWHGWGTYPCEGSWWDTWNSPEKNWNAMSDAVNQSCWVGWDMAFVLYSAPVLGACCDPSNGTCTLAPQKNCTSPLTWSGAVSCSPNPCPQRGACCTIGGGCSLTLQASCMAPSTWNGSWTACSPNPCPVPQGACCRYDESGCRVRTRAGCDSLGVAHQWMGGSTVCDPDPCPPAPCGMQGTTLVWDFGQGPQGFTSQLCQEGAAGAWQYGTQSEHGWAPGAVWSTVLDGVYPNHSGDALLSPPFQVNVGSRILSITHAYETEASRDGMNLAVNGQVLSPVGGYPETLGRGAMNASGDPGINSQTDVDPRLAAVLSPEALALQKARKDAAARSMPRPENSAPLRTGGDRIDDATIIPALPYHTYGNTCGHANDYDEVCPYAGSSSPDVVYSYTPLADEAITIDLCDGFYDTKVYVYDGPGRTLIACNDDACGSGGFNSTISNLQVLEGHTYFIVIDGYDGECGDYNLDVGVFDPCVVVCPSGAQQESEPPCTDDYDDSWNGGCNSVGWSDVYADSGTCATVCGKGCTFFLGGGYARDTDWYRMFAAGGGVTVTCSADFPVFLFLIYNTDCEDLAYESSSVSACESETIGRELPAGAEFWVVVCPQDFSGVIESDYRMDVCGITSDDALCVQGQAMWTGSSGGWQTDCFDLSSFDGQTVQAALRFGSGLAGTDKGCAISTIALGPIDPLGICCLPDGSCSLTVESLCSDTWGSGATCTPNPCGTSSAGPAPIRYQTELLGPTPNPSGAGAVVRFTLAQASDVSVEFFDAGGRLVRRLISHYGSGPGAVSWDRRTEDGRTVTPGTYFCRFSAGGVTGSATLILLK